MCVSPGPLGSTLSWAGDLSGDAVGAGGSAFFTPTPEEKQIVLQRRSPTNRIAFALRIGFLKMTGRSLNSVGRVPPDVLAHLGRVIECDPPRIASIRAFYRRRRTLFEHQAAARALLRRSEVSEHGLRGLTALLRREAIGIYNSMELAAKARVWLIGHGYLLPTEREIRRQTIRALHASRAAFLDSRSFRLARGRGLAGYELLDPRADPHGVIDRLAAAKLVLTESLHGAILADTYGIPWHAFATSKNFGVYAARRTMPSRFTWRLETTGFMSRRLTPDHRVAPTEFRILFLRS